jgi:phage replication initiation protein
MTEKRCIYIIDWLSFVTIRHNEVYEIIDLLGMPGKDGLKWEETKGYNYYQDRLCYDGVNILHNGRQKNMGIQVELSGRGCRTFETFGHGDFQSLFKLQGNDVDFKRLDIAFDDKVGIIPLDRLYRDTQQQNFTSDYHTYKCIEGTLGKSIEHGQKESDTMVRIYDKAMERNRVEEGHWVRIEIVLKHEFANGAVNLMNSGVHNISEIFLGATKKRLRYLKKPRKSKDSKKYRWETADYWENLIKEAEKIKLYDRVGVEYNIGVLCDHIDRNLGAISAYIDIYGIQNLYDRAVLRTFDRNPKYDRLVEQQKAFAAENRKRWEHLDEILQAPEY